MKGILIVLIASGMAGAQTLEVPPSESYSPAQIARAFAQCGDYIELSRENLQQFPMPKLEGVPYGGAQSGAAWLEACVLSKLLGNRATFQLLG